MSKTKLTNYDIKNICLRYLNEDISMEILANDYSVSASCISNSIHKAIYNEIISIDMAKEIRDKSAGNMDNKMRSLRIS